MCYFLCVCLCAQLLSCVRFFVAPWTVAHQASLFMELSRQEYWCGLPFPTPEDLPNPGTEPTSPASPALAGRFFLYHFAIWEALLFPVQSLTRGHRLLGTSSLERLVFTATALIFGDSSPQDLGDTLVMSLESGEGRVRCTQNCSAVASVLLGPFLTLITTLSHSGPYCLCAAKLPLHYSSLIFCIYIFFRPFSSLSLPLVSSLLHRPGLDLLPSHIRSCLSSLPTPSKFFPSSCVRVNSVLSPTVRGLCLCGHSS